MRHFSTSRSIAALAAVIGLSTASTTTATAQTPTPAAVPRIAGATISVSAGRFVPYRDPDLVGTDLTGSVQFPFGRFLVLEGEVTRSGGGEEVFTGGDNRLDRPFELVTVNRKQQDAALTMSGNLLLRTGGRVAVFGGGGLGGHRSNSRNVFNTTCIPRVPGACDSRPAVETRRDTSTRGSTKQLIGGVEVALHKYLVAFSAARWRTAPEPGLGVVGGLRVALQTRAAPEPRLRDQRTGDPVGRTVGVRVHVTSLKGDKRTGDLVSLSSSELTFRDAGHDVTLPLAEVRKVERVSHVVRNFTLTGAAAGFLIGYFGSCGGGDENDCWPEVGAVVAGIGAGAGALAGAGVKAANTERNLLYQSPRGSAALTVTPAVSPQRAGVNVGFAW